LTNKSVPISIEDDERHGDQIDAFIARNRDALNESIREARRQVAAGEVSKKSIDDIIAEGRRRHRESA
jgi:hypothetical protein